jgi:hypothetical protein
MRFQKADRLGRFPNRGSHKGFSGPGLWLVDAKIPEDFSYQGQIPLAIAARGIVSNGSTVWISPK